MTVAAAAAAEGPGVRQCGAAAHKLADAADCRPEPHHRQHYSSGWLPAFEIARIGSTDAEVKIKVVGNMFLFGLRPVRCQGRRRLGIHVTATGPRKRLQALRVCGGSTGKEC
jgi:hypothetical protein